MAEFDRSTIKMRGVALASGGLAIALLVILATGSLGLSRITVQEWLWAVTATVAIQSVLLIIPLRGWDERIPRDRHYLYTPLIGATLLLALYMFLAPELRSVILLGWFVALLFTAGLGGFRAVVGLSAILTAGYFAVAVLLHRRGYPLSLPFEAVVAGSALLIAAYAGYVLERLRSDRREMRDLRERLAAMALTDALTQLPNRRHFEEVLRAELDRVHRYGGQCTVAMVDVDHFKHYNDQLGHLAGDIVLRELAGVMRHEVRLHDMVARYGGEEFALIMINVGKAEAQPILERLLVAVGSHPFRHRHIQPSGRLTVSAGLASAPEDGTDFGSLLRRADAALYMAKRAGRNRLWVASDLATADRFDDA
jgi:diguanylate cyclase (GGDEF)-like protein